MCLCFFDWGLLTAPWELARFTSWIVLECLSFKVVIVNAQFMKDKSQRLNILIFSYFLRTILRTFYIVSLLFPRRLSLNCPSHNLLIKSHFIGYSLSSVTLFYTFTCTIWITSPKSTCNIVFVSELFLGKIKLTCL